MLSCQNIWAEKISKQELVKYKKKYIKTKSNLDLFNYSNALYLIGNYKSAYKGYRLVIRRNSKLKNSAQYYMALCLLKLNKERAALKLLKQLLNKKIKPSLNKTVVSKIKKLEAGSKVKKKVYLKRKAFNVFTEVSVGHNSNPGLDSENEIDFDDSGEEVSDIEYRGVLGGSYWVFDSLKFDMKLAASLSYTTYAEKQDLSNMLISARLPTAAYLGLYRFKFTPSYTQESDDSEPITSSFGGSFEVSKKLSKGLMSLGGRYSLNSPISDQFSYLEGDTVIGYGDFSYRFKKIGLSLYAEYFNNSYIDVEQNESNKGYQLAAKIRYSISNNVSLEAGYRYKNKSYNETDLFFDDGSRTFNLNLAREDALSQIDFAVKYYINNNFELKLGVSQIENKSTFDSIFTDVGDKNYELLDVKLSFGIYF